MNLNTNFEIWHSFLTEAIPYIKFEVSESILLFKRTAESRDRNLKYFYQNGPDSIDLTNIYDKTIMFAHLKGIANAKTENCQDY